MAPRRGLAGELRNGFAEAYAVEVHDEVDHIAAARAAATKPNLLFDID
jgi:hypothetical protein